MEPVNRWAFPGARSVRSEGLEMGVAVWSSPDESGN